MRRSTWCWGDLLQRQCTHLDMLLDCSAGMNPQDPYGCPSYLGKAPHPNYRQALQEVDPKAYEQHRLNFDAQCLGTMLQQYRISNRYCFTCQPISFSSPLSPLSFLTTFLFSYHLPIFSPPLLFLATTSSFAPPPRPPKF